MSALGRLVGPKDVFKHYVLGQLLREMSFRHDFSFNYYDFTPGPGQYQTQHTNSTALPQVFAYSRKMFQEQKVNPFHAYIEDIARFNSGEAVAGKKFPPPEDYAPFYYPSSAGFASLHLSERDRAVFIDSKPDTRASLSRLFSDEKRVNVVASDTPDTTVRLAKVLVPPTHHRGLVTWDLDLLIEDVAATEIKPQSQYSESHSQQMDEAASILHSVLKRWPTCTMYIPYPMTSHIPPISVVRTILNSGATQVLNCSVFWEKKGDVPGLAIGALIVNPPLTLYKSLEIHLKNFHEMFVPERHFKQKDFSRVYFVNEAKKDKIERPTMTGIPASPEVLIPPDFEQWVNQDVVREEKELMDSMGKFNEPTKFPDTPEGAEDQREWQRFITEQIANGQKPNGHTTIRLEKKVAPPVPTTPPTYHAFRKF